jgi:hypothetical protein
MPRPLAAIHFSSVIGLADDAATGGAVLVMNRAMPIWTGSWACHETGYNL